ncbi:helix-turn-helix domain-containing protein [Azospirillum cavernae]|nr:helix-turn-helix transcriptional regulator [Azospirillum cavernae]
MVTLDNPGHFFLRNAENYRADMLHLVHGKNRMRIRIVWQQKNALAHLHSLASRYMPIRMVNLAEKIIRLLNQHKLTQLELAEKIGVHQSTVNRWTKGADIKPENLIALASFIGQTVDDFLLSESVDATISDDAAMARLIDDMRTIGSVDPEARKNFQDYAHKQAETFRARLGLSE